MTVQEAQQQRVIWEAQGRPPCWHPVIENEIYPTGEPTGFQVCTSCGEYMEEEIEGFFDEGESV